MGKVRARLESYKAPRLAPTGGRAGTPTAFGPRHGSGGKAFNPAAALALLRSLQQQEGEALNSQLRTLRHGGAMDAGSVILGKINEGMRDVDSLLAQLGITDGGEL